MTDTTAYDGSTPGSSQFGLFQSTADAALKNALARIGNQRGSLLQQSGFEGVYDPVTGAYQSAKVAGDNPFGAYQGMMRNFADTGEQSDAAQAGLGFKGGLANQMNDRTQMGLQQGKLDFASQFQDKIAGLGDQQAQAQIDHDQQLYDEKLKEVQLGIENGDFNPTQIPNPTDPTAGGTPTYGTDPGWNPAPVPGTKPGKPPRAGVPQRRPNETRAQFHTRLYNYRHRKGGK